jgi:large subunit ribosomal protein L2
MGKRIITQARGKGSRTYRVRKKAFKFKLKYPSKLSGEGTVIKLLDSLGHTSPVAKINHKEGSFYIPAFKGMVEGQKINFEGKEVKEGNILRLKDIPIKTPIYCIESRPGDGGVFIKTGGSSGTVNKVIGNYTFVLMPSKKEKKFNSKCRAIVGVVAGAGRLDKPILRAGKRHKIKR